MPPLFEMAASELVVQLSRENAPDAVAVDACGDGREVASEVSRDRNTEVFEQLPEERQTRRLAAHAPQERVTCDRLVLFVARHERAGGRRGGRGVRGRD